jgi:hypothetical protein
VSWRSCSHRHRRGSGYRHNPNGCVRADGNSHGHGDGSAAVPQDQLDALAARENDLDDREADLDARVSERTHGGRRNDEAYR